MDMIYPLLPYDTRTCICPCICVRLFIVVFAVARSFRSLCLTYVLLSRREFVLWQRFWAHTLKTATLAKV